MKDVQNPERILAEGRDRLENGDVKKVFVQTDVKVSGTINADVDLDPWIVGFGIGHRF